MKKAKQYEFQGEMLTLEEISDLTGIPKYVFYGRIKRGWRLAEVFSTPAKRMSRAAANALSSFTVNGETKTVKEWAEHAGISLATIYRRIKMGWKPEDVISTKSEAVGVIPPITYNGETKTLREWAEYLGVAFGPLARRYRAGCPIDRLLNLAGNRRAEYLNQIVEWNGEAKAIGEWSSVTGIPGQTIAIRLSCGWAVDEALTTPGNKRLVVEWNGKKKTLAQWAKWAGINSQALRLRLFKGIPFEQAITTAQSVDEIEAISKECDSPLRLWLSKGELSLMKQAAGNQPVEQWAVERLLAIVGANPDKIRRVMSLQTSTKSSNRQSLARKHSYMGQMLTIREISRLSGVSYYNLRWRMKGGMSAEEAASLQPASPKPPMPPRKPKQGTNRGRKNTFARIESAIPFIAAGMSAERVADICNLSAPTIRKHINEIRSCRKAIARD